MGVSYELSRREDRIGGPEKPLSELGSKGYMQFWTARVAKTVLELKNKSSLTVAEVAERCFMLPDDVMAVFKEMGVLGGKKKTDGGLMLSKAKIRDFAVKNGLDLASPVDEDGFLEEFMNERLENGV